MQSGFDEFREGVRRSDLVDRLGKTMVERPDFAADEVDVAIP